MSHARLGPSNHRWPHCPGSVQEEAKYPDVSGEAAVDGTGSHLLLELCLLGDKKAVEFEGQIIGVNDPDKPNGWTVHHDRCERVQMCLDYIDRRKTELAEQFPDCTITVEAETKADPGGYFGRTDWWGTVDITIAVLNPEGGLHFIEIVDYKDGRGWVNEQDNSQLLAYCGGKMRPYVGSGPELVRPFRTNRVGACRMTIVQPKTNPVVRYQDATAEYVMDKLIELDSAADKTDKTDAPLIPGKHCQWCKANPKRGGHCTASGEQSLEVMKTMIPTTNNDDSLLEQVSQLVANIESLDNDQLAKLADVKDGLLSTFDKVEEEIQNRIEAGQQVPGYAMQPGRSSYVWNSDEETVVKALKARRLKLQDIYPPKLISPAQVKKLDNLTSQQKKRLMDDYVTEKVGALKLKKVSRKEQASAEEMFKEVQQETVAVEAPVSFF